MCGIAGLYNFGGSGREQRDAVLAMRDAMSHRGPDDAGLWESPDAKTLDQLRQVYLDMEGDLEAASDERP